MKVRRFLARQLANPSGLAGRLVGQMMKIANQEPTRLAIEALDVQPGNRVLDLGCGPGQAAEQLRSLTSPGQVIGIDQSSTMIRQAQRSNWRHVLAGEMEFHVAQFDALPFEDGSFDCVLASNVMYFWKDTGAALAEIRRILRPGGRLSVYVTSAESMSGWGFAEAGTHRLFLPHEVAEALTSAGFDAADIALRTPPVGRGVTGIVATARYAVSDTGILQAA